jgi:hypothetical protein
MMTWTTGLAEQQSASSAGIAAGMAGAPGAVSFALADGCIDLAFMSQASPATASCQ